MMSSHEVSKQRRRNATLKLTMPSALEAKEQTSLFQWRTAAGIRRWPELRWLHAIPNGMAASSVGVAARMKRQGMMRGIPDVCLPVARHGFHGLYLEMKRRDGSIRDLTPEQRECIEFLQQQGYAAYIAYGWEDAVNLIEGYLTVKCSSQPSTDSADSVTSTADHGSPGTDATGLTGAF